MKPKIKNSILCNNYQDGGLKNLHIKPKIINLPCAWVKCLSDDNMHNWNVLNFVFNA